MNTPLENEVAKRFGVLPNFFRLTASDPEITKNLWGFTQFAYLDNPLPSLFKERLFVYLSRFCEVRYCIARHLGFLVGLGYPAGDSAALTQTVEAVLPLLRRFLPQGDGLMPLLAVCAEFDSTLFSFPAPESPGEQALFACATHLFLQTRDSSRAHEALVRALGTGNLERLKLFLAFVRTAHYWTKLHPELTFEDDVIQLLSTHETLTQCILKDPEAQMDSLGVHLSAELASLRKLQKEHETIARAYSQLSIDHKRLTHSLHRTEEDLREVTSAMRAREEALARQKLESLGVLAGGIAHDFNNLLGTILALAELLEADLAADLFPGDEIERIKTVAIHGAEIVRQLMIYGGQDKTGLVESMDLSRLVDEMVGLLKVSVSKHAVLKINIDKNLPAVSGNISQIRQMVMNLVINASEAIGDREGLIHVSISHVTGEPGSTANDAPKLPTADWLHLEVSDTGCGMTEETRAKIFDPFFTTKFAGRGLGLAAVQGTVRDHGGTVTVVSAPGQGATFRVMLPCTSERPLEVPNVVTPFEAKQSSARAGTILVVEDEGVLRQAVAKVLQKRGFSVMQATDGSAAMELIRTHKDDIDVVLLDVTLPGISSREVFWEARRLRPDLKVVVTSAYGKETADASFAGLRVDHFIRKPFHLADLVRVFETALSAKATGHTLYENCGS